MLVPPGVNTPLYSTRYPHRNRAWESSRRARYAVDSQTRFQRGYQALSIDVFTPGGTSYEQSVMDGKRVGDTLELDNAIYRIKEITVWDSGDGETASLELVSGEGEIAECYELSRNYSDKYYTPSYYDGIMMTDILYSGSLFFSKECIVKVNNPRNNYKSHSVTIEDFFTLYSDEVGAQFGGYSEGISLWGGFETDSSGLIISYWEYFLS